MRDASVALASGVARGLQGWLDQKALVKKLCGSLLVVLAVTLLYA